jgi:hypothetical protein
MDVIVADGKRSPPWERVRKVWDESDELADIQEEADVDVGAWVDDVDDDGKAFSWIAVLIGAIDGLRGRSLRVSANTSILTNLKLKMQKILAC